MKKAIIISGLLLLSACTYKTGGNVPEDKKNPTLVEEMIVAGAFFDKSHIERRTHAQFSEDNCKSRGYSTYDGYAVSNWYTGGVMIGFLPITDSSKTIKIWCKK